MTEPCAIPAFCAADVYSHFRGPVVSHFGSLSGPVQQKGDLVHSTMAEQVIVCWDLRIHVYAQFPVCKHCATTLIYAGNCLCSLAECSENKFCSSLLTIDLMRVQVARQGSMAEQQMHQQQLKALHDDLQAVRVHTFRPACLFCQYPYAL